MYVLFSVYNLKPVDAAPSQIPTLFANVANSMTDGRADLLSHTLTMRGDHVACS